MEERIVKFIKRHHVLTLATVNEAGMPYVANCFYAYDAKRNLFIFTSDDTTRHGAEMVANANKPKQKSKWQMRLEEAQRMQQQMQNQNRR